MLKPFLEYLESGILVCDGAMGTQLYSKGVFLNRCFDELNLSRPLLVREVHQEYVHAGAEILETNTFGANRIKLEPHGLADRVREINLSGVKIAREVSRGKAFIGGSIGPLGLRVEPYGKLSREEAREIFAEQIAALAEGGVDFLCLETFSDRNEVQAAIAAAKSVCHLPVMAQLTLQDDGNSMDGAPPETFGPELESWGADVVGVNCGVGPQVMLESIERLAKVVTRKIVAQPNAGKPRNFEGRNLYLSSPEYMASYARRFVKAGVRVVGGCCGTTPAHIEAIRNAVVAPPSNRTLSFSSGPVEAAANEEAPSPGQKGRFSGLLREDRLNWVVEILPPRGADPGDRLEAARLLKEAGVDAIRVSEAPRASARMGALALAVMIGQQSGIEPILHYSCSYRNLLAMQSELLGAAAMGLRNLLLSDGEPLRVGDYLDATAVFDVDSVGLTHLVRGLNRGRDLGGKSIGAPTGFCLGVLVNPSVLNLDEEVRRLERKVEAGAEFAVTEPIFRPEVLEKFVKRTRHCGIPVLASVRPLGSYREAEFFNNEVPGMSIADSHLTRMREAVSAEQARREGLRIASEILRDLRGMVKGIEVSIADWPPQTAVELWSLASTGDI